MMTGLFISLHNTVFKLLPILVIFASCAVFMFGFGLPDEKAYLYSFAVSAVMLLAFKLKVAALNVFFMSLIKWLNRLVSKLDLKLVLLIGVSLRVVYWFLIEPKQVSDLATYVDLANNLTLGGSYFYSSTHAYWPVGYPLLLSATHLFHFDINNFSILMLNIAVYLASSLTLYSLAKNIYDVKVASIAVFIFAIWPTNAMLVGYAMKEYIVLFMLLLAVNLYLRETFKYKNLLAGMCLGVAVLVQPSCILFFTVFVVTSWYRKLTIRAQLLQLVAILFGMAIVISPWSLRNYQVFDQFVMVSTNGGSNLYRANNELAHGGYLERTIPEVELKTEVERDAEYKMLAKEWIVNNPADFIVLSFRKMNLFLGDDSVGAYLSLKVGSEQPVSSMVYYLIKMLSNLYWVLLWIVILYGWKDFSQDLTRDPRIVAITLSFLYFFTIHSVFESNAKYHFVVIWVLSIIVARVFCRTESAALDR